MRRLLRIPDGPAAPEGAAQRAFSTSIMVSATRCILTYVVLPFVAPVLGFAAGVGPVIGIPIGVAAIVCNVLTIRRFWAADHRWRWAYTALSLTVISLLVVLMVKDLASVLS
jgi:heme O synthase-like polyprenyltransferase